MEPQGARDVELASNPRFPPTLDLRIDHLAIDGLPALDQVQFANSLEAELARLSAEREPPAGQVADVAIDRLATGYLSLALPIRAHALGRQVADIVLRGLGQLDSESSDPTLTPNGANRKGFES
jgi:hypothetical protein